MKLSKLAFFVMSTFWCYACATTSAAEPKQNATQPQKQQVSKSQPKTFAEELNDALATGTPEDALKYFEKLPAEKANSEEMQLLKASLCFSAGRESEAKATADAILAKDPNNVDALTLSMVLAKKRGDKNAKSAAIKKILAVDPMNPDANIELGEEQVLRHKYGPARNYYQIALKKDPNNLDALFGFAQMSYYIEKDNDAKETFEKMLQIDPNNAMAYCYLGKLEAENKRYKAAKEYVEKAISLEPNETSFYLDLGTYSRFLGKYPDAEKAWSKAIETAPDYFLGYAYRAGLYDELEKWDLALEDYRKVIEKNPKYYYAYESLGILAWRAGNWAESRTAFLNALKVNPDSISYKLMVSATYQREKNLVQNKSFTESMMKGLDKNKLDYLMLRLYHDRSGDMQVTNKVQNEQNRTTRGKMLYYLALYFDLMGKDELAKKYYTDVAEMKNPMFFEYRLAEWSIKK